MTTINQFSDLPSAEAIGVLANELFPDLTEGVYGVPEQDIPASDVPEINSADFTQGYGTGLPGVDIAGVGALGEDVPGVNVPDVSAQNYTGSVPEVNASYLNQIPAGGIS